MLIDNIQRLLYDAHTLTAQHQTVPLCQKLLCRAQKLDSSEADSVQPANGNCCVKSASALIAANPACLSSTNTCRRAVVPVDEVSLRWHMQGKPRSPPHRSNRVHGDTAPLS
jgi:hypothetical protein